MEQPPISPPQEASENDVLFEAQCFEGEGSVTRKARPMILTSDDVVNLWFKLRQFPILFASPQETNFKNFVSLIQDEYSVLVEFGDVGMAMVSGIVPGIEAKIHISFWDSRLKGREPLIRELVRWTLDVFGVRRVSMPIRADARAMRAFAERVGLYFEGALKNWVKKDNRLFDLHLYGVTEPEVDELWMRGKSWAKPRVRPLKVYETK